MSVHEWKVLGSFGLLLGGLALVDARLAGRVALIATAVIVVKNANKLPLVG